MPPDEEIIVEVPDVEPALQVETAKPEGDGKPAKERNERGQFAGKSKSDDGMDDLKAQLEAKTKAATDAQQRADERDAEAKKQAKLAQDATERLTQVQQSARTSDISAVDASLRQAQTEADQAQAQQQAAYEAGDFKAASEWGRKMARAEAKVSRLEEGKADLELQAKEEAKKPAPKPEVAATVDAQGDVTKPHPKAEAWLKQHPEYLTDRRKQALATSAHWGAVAEGLSPDQDEYYSFVEDALGLKAKPSAKKEAKVERQEKSFSAPVSRDDAPSAGASSTKVTLTAGEVANATDGTLTWNRDDPAKGIKRGMPIGVHEMARRKLAMQKEGRYASSMTDQ